MKRFTIDLGERLHGLNLLSGGSLTDAELRIPFGEVDNGNPNEIYNQDKK